MSGNQALEERLNQLTPYFVRSLDPLIDICHTYERVQKQYVIICDRYGIHSNSSIPAFKLAIFEALNPLDLMDPAWFKLICCYSPERCHPQPRLGGIAPSQHRFIILNKCIKPGKPGKSVRVMEGDICVDADGKQRCNIPVVVKLYQSERHIERNTSHEMAIYSKLKDVGCPVPWVSQKFLFWEQPVLVMRKLDVLDSTDDEYEVASQAIEQLEYLHKFAVHSDIKPGNIMKLWNDGEGIRYFVIDYGGATTIKFKDGYQRWIWSPRYTSQPRGEKQQVTYPKVDLLELAYTMRELQLIRSRDRHNETDIKTGFKGRLKRYVKQVERLSNHPSADDYRALRSLLSKRKPKHR